MSVFGRRRRRTNGPSPFVLSVGAASGASGIGEVE
jgi:hypothetical protein